MVFDPQPTLKGVLVAVRPLRADDYDALYAVASDPLIWAQHPNPDRYREHEFGKFFHDSLDAGGAVAVRDARDGRIIGSSRYHGYDADCEVEIGWTFLARTHWGGRFNGELKCLMLAHAFRFFGTVIFLVAPVNLRSQRAVEKVGGVRAGVRTDADGHENIVYHILSPTTSQPIGTRLEGDARVVLHIPDP